MCTCCLDPYNRAQCLRGPCLTVENLRRETEGRKLACTNWLRQLLIFFRSTCAVRSFALFSHETHEPIVQADLLSRIRRETRSPASEGIVESERASESWSPFKLAEVHGAQRQAAANVHTCLLLQLRLARSIFSVCAFVQCGSQCERLRPGSLERRGLRLANILRELGQVLAVHSRSTSESAPTDIQAAISSLSWRISIPLHHHHLSLSRPSPA